MVLGSARPPPGIVLGSARKPLAPVGLVGMAAALGPAAPSAAAVAVPMKPKPPQVSSVHELFVVAADAFAGHKPIPSFDITGSSHVVSVDECDAVLMSAMGRPTSLGPSSSEVSAVAPATPIADQQRKLRSHSPLVRSRSPRGKREGKPLIPDWAIDAGKIPSD